MPAAIRWHPGRLTLPFSNYSLQILRNCRVALRHTSEKPKLRTLSDPESPRCFEYVAAEGCLNNRTAIDYRVCNAFGLVDARGQGVKAAVMFLVLRHADFNPGGMHIRTPTVNLMVSCKITIALCQANETM